jgi:hypothetical protein
MALHTRTNENNMANISRNEAPLAYKFSEMREGFRKCAAENGIHKLGLSPSRNKVSIMPV